MVVADWPLTPDDFGRICKRDLCGLKGAAICNAHDHVLCNVNETSREVAGVCRSKRGVSQSLTCTVGGDEVLENRHPLTEV